MTSSETWNVILIHTHPKGNTFTMTTSRTSLDVGKKGKNTNAERLKQLVGDDYVACTDVSSVAVVLETITSKNSVAGGDQSGNDPSQGQAVGNRRENNPLNQFVPNQLPTCAARADSRQRDETFGRVAVVISETLSGV